MNLKKIMISFLCPLLLFGGCASDSVSDVLYSDITEEMKESIEDTEITSVEISEQLSDSDITEEMTEPNKDIKITSMEYAEQLSESDLIYLAQHSKTVTYEDMEEFDLFGVELMSETLQVPIYKTSKSINEIDPLSCITSEEIRQIADEGNHDFMKRLEPKEPDDLEYILCGENDWYIEYSIRYTDVVTLNENNVPVTHIVPRAYRRVYMKTMAEAAEGERLLLGELSAEYVQQQLDLYAMSRHASIQGDYILYREVTESENAYVYSYLYSRIVGGDWGLNDTAYLKRGTWTVDKQTHEMQISWDTIKEAEIEGTADRW